MNDKKVVYRARPIKIFDGKDVPIRTSNAYGFGTRAKDRNLYFVSMKKVVDEKGKEKYKKEIHTIIDDTNKEIKVIEEDKVEKLFNELKFY